MNLDWNPGDHCLREVFCQLRCIYSNVEYGDHQSLREPVIDCQEPRHGFGVDVPVNYLTPDSLLVGGNTDFSLIEAIRALGYLRNELILMDMRLCCPT